MSVEQQTAYQFPGQSAQEVGMGKDLYDNFDCAKRMFKDADEILGMPITQISFEGPAETLADTAVAQAAVFTNSVAYYEVLSNEFPDAAPKPNIVLGHSQGEFAAHVVAGSLSFEDGLRLLALRGKLLKLKSPGRMAVLRYVPRELVIQICAKTGAEVANINTQDQIVIAGTHESLREAETFFPTLPKSNSRYAFVPLLIDVASHCSLALPVAEEIAIELEKIHMGNSLIPVISNVTADFVQSGEDSKRLLANQLIKTVLWLQSILLMLDSGVDTVVEVGHSTSYTNMAKKIAATSGRQLKTLNSRDIISKALGK